MSEQTASYCTSCFKTVYPVHTLNLVYILIINILSHPSATGHDGCQIVSLIYMYMYTDLRTSPHQTPVMMEQAPASISKSDFTLA